MHLNPHTFIYNGGSMWPTFKPADLMVVAPCEEGEPCCGDVVVFKAPDSGVRVVHRVVGKRNRYLLTRGDNNSWRDPYLLDCGEIIGRVVRVRRNGRGRPIRNGAAGRRYAKTLFWLRCGTRWVSCLLHPLYRRLSDWGAGRWLGLFLPSLRVLTFERPNGTELQLLLGRRIIGTRRAGTEHWNIKRPFRLLVDEGTLGRGNVETWKRGNV